jgi:energy-coupling factor transporter ATP-binding protein EcfA2
MRIKCFKLEGYSSFRDTGMVNLEPGFNLFIGQNNSGKSALLRSLLLPLQDNRHRSLKVFQNHRLPPPTMQIELTLSRLELEDSFLARTGHSVLWSQNNVDFFSMELTDESQFAFKQPAGQLFQLTPPSSPTKCIMLYSGIGRLEHRGDSNGIDNTSEFIAPHYQSNLFFFDAQRFAVGKCNAQASHSRLQSRADNLPAILSELQGRQPTTLDTLCRYLREIFSTVHTISTSAAPDDRGSTVIWVWPTEHQHDPELQFELDNCGTGVSQVLAILTVALTMKRAIIVIDEINAFLHPSAVKALLRILQTHHSEHQYIISAHSTEVMVAASPSTVHLIRRIGYDSTVERLDLGKIASLREAARELGVSMTDVFAADRIIWVEGASEANCFPFLYAKLLGEIPQGTKFSPVATTGDFQSKKVSFKRVSDIYDTIAKHMVPLVEQVAFSFDRERLTEKQATELENKSNGRLLLLPRRCFECYLLDPSAISQLIQTHVPDLAKTATSEAVACKLKELGGLPEFGASGVWNSDLVEPKWLEKVDGARLIDKVVSDITETRLRFDKVRDTIVLARHISGNRPSALDGLKSYLDQLMKIAMSTGTA